MITGSEPSSCRSRCSTSSPSSSPSLRSSSTTSTGCSRTCSSASVPSQASSALKPRSRAHSPMENRSERSSSTTSRVWTVCVAGGLASLAMSFLHGESQEHGRAASFAARHLDDTAVLLHDGLADRKPEAGAARLGGKERIEQLGQHLARDADAGVDHADLLILEEAT